MATERNDPAEQAGEAEAVRLAVDKFVRLVVDEGHLDPGEHYDLRLAADLASRTGQVTWLIGLDGKVCAAIVPPEEAALVLGLFPPG
jgi:hypothetical protein